MMNKQPLGRPASNPMMEDSAGKDPKVEKPDTNADMSVSLFGVGDPLDKRKRDKAERVWNEAMTVFLEKQYKRVMKSARAMKGEQ